MSDGRVEQLGRYEIVSKLASGGMGEVFLAKVRGAAGFEKLVVIKKILPHLVEHKQFVEGLVREAKLLVMLNHPNIVQVFDLGFHETDYFMAMEFVHGYNLATIARYCAQKRITIPAAACAYIGLQVLSGLAYAHTLSGGDGAHNIIHRDVSPQNVIVATDGMVKLTDFGIAKVLDQAEAELTRSLKGKFRYMAPEAVDGMRIDQRYDIFAVGILLFEALCRRHLFTGRGDVEILRQVRQAKVPSIEHYHPEVPQALAEATRRALAKDPDQRFQSADEFAEALRSAMLPTTENQGRETLRSFVADLFSKADFPIDKPKLPDLDAVDPDVTRSVMLSSSLERAIQRPARAKRSSKAPIGWPWVITVVSIVGLGGLLVGQLWFQRPAPGTTKPVIVRVQHSEREVGVTPEGGIKDPDLSRMAEGGTPDAASATQVGSKGRARPKKKAVRFTERLGRDAFRRSGRPLRRCFDRFVTGEQQAVALRVISTIKSTGRVASVRIEPASAEQTPLGRCVRGVALRIRYPRHDRSSVTFLQPLRIRRQ